MDTLDSRMLSYIDCFARRFSAPGVVQYRLSSAVAACVSAAGDEFTVEVGESKQKSGSRRGSQYDVSVRLEGSRLVAEPPTVVLDPGDFVLWHAVDATTPPFVVRGEDGQDTFDSTSLTADTLYSHAFGLPGEYRWLDAQGSKLSGEVVVRDHDASDPADCQRLMDALAKGRVVTISGSKADPRKVEIVTGQRVFWIVARADGITVTDARLTVTRKGEQAS